MALSFDRLPITTLVGADSPTYHQVTDGSTIEKMAKFRTTTLCQRLLAPLYRLNDRIYRQTDMPKIISPLFIIGHWRSGTTFAHNLLSQDPQFGYCTTYQTVFPHLMLRGNLIMQRLAAMVMPTSRPTDNSALSISQPQEEEFAIANITPASYYHFWIFPRQMALYREKFLLFNSCSQQEIDDFCRATVQVARTALYCQGKSRFLSKNPPHTARIPILLKLFPDAKFVYIHRKADDVIASTKRFFRQTIDAIALQTISTAELNEQIVENYHAVINKYEQDKALIADGALCEVSFNRLTAHPRSTIEKIYRDLDL